MWSRSHGGVASATFDPDAPTRRRHHRQKLRHLAYVKVDSANGGILLDVGESGMSTRMVLPLSPDQRVHLRVDLPEPRLHFEAEGRVSWTDSSGQTGIELSELAPRSARMLKEWLFTQLLANAYRLHVNAAEELSFSSEARPTIPMRPSDSRSWGTPLRFLWLPVSAPGFARLVDGLTLLCAALLFCVLSLTLIDFFPPWPMAAAIFFGASGIFALAYGCMFSWWFRTTPGRRLAEMAGRRMGTGKLKEDQARFR